MDKIYAIIKKVIKYLNKVLPTISSEYKVKSVNAILRVQEIENLKRDFFNTIDVAKLEKELGLQDEWIENVSIASSVSFIAITTNGSKYRITLVEDNTNE